MTLYCIKKNDKLLMHTIAEWRRATIVTYLLQDMGQKVFCTDTDYTVDSMWTGLNDGAELIEVTVAEKPLLKIIDGDLEGL